MKITFKNPFYDYEEDKLFLNQFKIPEEINITESKTREKITNGIKKADNMLKGSNISLTDKNKNDFYASSVKQSLWDGIDDFKVKEARKEGYSALNASKAKRTNIQKELEEYAKLHKDKKEEKKLAPNRTLSKVSKVLDTASTIPTLDRFASAWQAPIDLAKGDYVSAALDVAGSVSGSSGISKLAKELWKTLKKQDKKTLDKISNTLTAASLIPYADTVTNALQVPVDLARGDYFGAGMSALGVIPVYGEVADTAKAGRTAGKALKAVSEGVELADDIGDTAKLADDAVDFAKTTVKNFVDFPKNVHSGRQGKHIVGHNNYQKGKSVFSGTTDDAEKLIKEFAGKGQKVNDTVERVDFKKIIGQYVDMETGEIYDTTVGTIRYSQNGAHIVPAKPKNWRK